MTELETKKHELAKLEESFAHHRLLYRAHRDTLRAEIRELRESAVAVRKSRAGVRLSAHTQAGRENLARVRDALTEAGPVTQARLCELTEINSGTMTWCIRALLEDGTVRETGVRVRNSREVALVPAGKVSTAPPGS